MSSKLKLYFNTYFSSKIQSALKMLQKSLQDGEKNIKSKIFNFFRNSRRYVLNKVLILLHHIRWYIYITAYVALKLVCRKVVNSVKPSISSPSASHTNFVTKSKILLFVFPMPISTKL